MKFTENMEYRKELMDSLNSKVLIPGMIQKAFTSVYLTPVNLANAAELQTLDLYGALKTLPKHSAEQDIGDGSPHSLPIGAPELSTSNYKARAKAKGQESKKVTEEMEISKKEMGRMKGKMKVLEKAREQERGREKNAMKDLVRKRDEEGGENDAEKGLKKIRVDGDGLVDVME